MSSIKITGQVVHVNQGQTAGQSYQFQTAIILINPGQYQTYVEVQFSGEKLPLIGQLQINGVYDFSINVRGVKQPVQAQNGQTKGYITFDVWKVEQAGQAQQAPLQNNNFGGNQGAIQPNNNFAGQQQNNNFNGGQQQGSVGVPQQQQNNNFGGNGQQQQGFGGAPSGNQNNGGFGSNQPQQQQQGFGGQTANNFGGNNGGFGGGQS